MRVLVVEDNPKMAQAIRKGLTEHAYNVQVCHTGFEGEEKAARDEFDVIVVDRMLPDRDGIEICRNLRLRRVTTPILMLTALSGTTDKIAGLDAGADDYMTKPFEFDEFIARIRALVRRGQTTQSRVLTCDDLRLDLDKRAAVRECATRIASSPARPSPRRSGT
jgi:DNA-binding response OmpR family regulator